MWRTAKSEIDKANMMELVLLLVLLVGSVRLDDSVHIRSKYGQMVTSSTLRWVTGESGSKPEDAVLGSVEKKMKEGEEEVEDENVFVCRARHNGAWLPGRLGSNSKACHVSLLGHVYAIDRYEVLQNEEKGGRLTWVHWNRSIYVPEGAVGGGDSKLYYVARRAAKVPGADYRSHYLVGKLDTTEGMGRISVAEKPEDRPKDGRRAAHEVTDEVEKHYTDGQVLVETEPVSYELSGLKFNRWRNKVKRTEVLLATGQLRNEEGHNGDGEESPVDTVLTFTSDYSVYWGQGKAMLKGLPTAVVDKEDEDKEGGGGVETFQWGLEERGSKQEVKRVEAKLLPGTAANVSVIANRTEIETPYTGNLVAYFADENQMSRPVSGSRRRVELRDVKVVVGPAFFLSDFSLVPTTTTTTTTEPPTSTTTSTTREPEAPTPAESVQEEEAHSMLEPAKEWDSSSAGHLQVAALSAVLASLLMT